MKLVTTDAALELLGPTLPGNAGYVDGRSKATCCKAI